MFDSGPSAPVQRKDVGIGTLIWYKGFTSMGSWDCPAVIFNICKVGFYIMSLDDMMRQHQLYTIEVAPNSPPSRIHMRLASIAEVDSYLAGRKNKENAQQIVAHVQDATRYDIDTI